MASGNLGLITFPREPGRVTVERLDEIHPELLGTLRDHPGIGFLTITQVKVSPDLQVARVYYTTLGDEPARRDTARALGVTTGTVKSQTAP